MGKGRVQYGALPWRLGPSGLEVLMITTRTTRRWIIPKGWPMEGRAPHEAAAQEAWEEAGVRGEVSTRAAGAFDYDKLKTFGRVKRIRVEVFPLEVVEEAAVWPEAAQRERRWFAQAEAAEVAGEPELAPLLAAFTR
ncbi:MAG TPA: NUDIX hydrolase [Caulobacteraceae bacterium]|nr:NUDIX hydrolase [Caulobacteraceae bacterium]